MIFKRYRTFVKNCLHHSENVVQFNPFLFILIVPFSLFMFYASFVALLKYPSVEFVMGLVFLAFSFYLLYAFHTIAGTFLKIDKRGIQVNDNKIVEWSEFHSYEFFTEGRGKHKSERLRFWFKRDGKLECLIHEIRYTNKNRQQIIELIEKYSRV